MFIHGKTNKIYYSVREKIKYYNDCLKGKFLKPGQRLPAYKKEYAEFRIAQLKGSIKDKYNEPTIIVTNDKFFGNPIAKPRLSVVIDEDNKGRILCSPILPRTSKNIILDNDIDRQIGDKRKWIDKSEIYETKYIENACSLTNYDKKKIINILRKK